MNAIPAADARSEKESLKEEMRTVIEEARMVLPGMQALFGFQTMAVFNARFEGMPHEVKVAYLVALGLLTIAMGLLMTPAAYHRLAERGKVSGRIIKLSSTFITAGMVPLMFALAIDVFVVAVATLNSEVIGMCGAAATIGLLSCLWFLYPLTRADRRDR